MKKNEIRILVVDDDEKLARMLADYLNTLGYHTALAFDGMEAVECFSAGSFQIVVTDMLMPKMDGLELINQIKTLDPQALVVVMTGQASIENAVNAMKNGAYDYFCKPFKLDELRSVVERAIERQTLLARLGVFRGLTLALIVSVPIWLLLGIALGWAWN